jgi:hypothetical protein
MNRASLEPVLVLFGVPAVGVLLGMGWYKITTRIGRPFEPTLWFVFRWGYIFVFLSGVGASFLGKVLEWYSFDRLRFVLSMIAFALALVCFFGLAIADWRRAVEKEQRFNL